MDPVVAAIVGSLISAALNEATKDRSKGLPGAGKSMQFTPTAQKGLDALMQKKQAEMVMRPSETPQAAAPAGTANIKGPGQMGSDAAMPATPAILEEARRAASGGMPATRDVLEEARRGDNALSTTKFSQAIRDGMDLSSSRSGAEALTAGGFNALSIDKENADRTSAIPQPDFKQAVANDELRRASTSSPQFKATPEAIQRTKEQQGDVSTLERKQDGGTDMKTLIMTQLANEIAGRAGAAATPRPGPMGGRGGSTSYSPTVPTSEELLRMYIAKLYGRR